VILLISNFQVSKITDVSHWRPAYQLNFLHVQSGLYILLVLMSGPYWRQKLVLKDVLKHYFLMLAKSGNVLFLFKVD
jgi:hypothetical protein